MHILFWSEWLCHCDIATLLKLVVSCVLVSSLSLVSFCWVCRWFISTVEAQSATANCVSALEQHQRLGRWRCHEPQL